MTVASSSRSSFLGASNAAGRASESAQPQKKRVQAMRRSQDKHLHAKLKKMRVQAIRRAQDKHLLAKPEKKAGASNSAGRALSQYVAYIHGILLF
jgi:hypothetical protein